jgi:hypothetical protein
MSRTLSSRKHLTRFSMAFLLLLSLALALLPGLPGEAQTNGWAPPEFTIQPDGVTDATTLPPAVSRDRHHPREHPRGLHDPELFKQHKSRMAQAQAIPAQPFLPLGPSAFTSLTSFIGLSEGESGGFYPPDTQVAAGPNHVLELVNVEGRIFSKAGTVVASFNLNTFFNLPSSTFLTDPKIRYDPRTGRWFVLAATLESPAGTWRLAVSTTSDPTGTFVRYTLPSANGTLPDFPALGFNDDNVVVTANAFGLRNGRFVGTEFWVLNKAQLVAGVGVTGTFFSPPQGLFTIQPAYSLSASSTLFMAAVQFGKATSVRIWSVTGVPGLGSGVHTTTTNRSIGSLSIPPDARQLGTSFLIQTNDNSLLDAVYRSGALWLTANAACVPSGDTRTRACLRFIQVLTSSLKVNQDFNFGIAQIDHYYPAVQVDGGGNLFTVFSRSSPSEYPSVYASGRKASDSLNTLRQPALLKVGEASYFDGRWGDYSGAGIDVDASGLPTDLVWVAGEYARAGAWGTLIGRLGF